MTDKSPQKFDIGMIGLGVMGRNLVLNITDHGFSVIGHDKDQAQIDALLHDAENPRISAAKDIKVFISSLKQPRAIMMLVPAGAPVDAVIHELSTYLEPGDLIIDGGNSYFKDTDFRARNLAAKGIDFLGVGISGGEEGARKGPSLMPGGPREAYERVRPILEAIAAKVNGEPCVKWLGPKSAGHFVKMVHNGIEYGIMQLIAESYDLMKRGLGLNDDELSHAYAEFNRGELNGYLMEITSHIFSKKDPQTNKPLIDEILDVAKQKGTGMWTTQSAMALQVPIPTIDVAVAMRDLSVFVKEREEAHNTYHVPSQSVKIDRKSFLTKLQHALYTAIVITYAQGFSLLKIASEQYQYHLDLEVIARIWRGGCIIRSAFLNDVCIAFKVNSSLSSLLLDRAISKKIKGYQTDLREIICHSATLGIPIPGLMVSLGYFDAFCSAWLPTNLIQAQRDYFGAHTYERIDAKGTFHMEWEKGIAS